MHVKFGTGNQKLSNFSGLAWILHKEGGMA